MASGERSRVPERAKGTRVLRIGGRVMKAESSEDPPFADVIRWRCEKLVEAGYPNEEALVLSERTDVDLHRALALLEQGCDVPTALRILL